MEQEAKEEKVEKTVSNSEIDETNDNGIPRTLSFDKEDTFNEEDPDKIISDLTNKVVLLEKRYNDLRGKYENLVRNNIQKSSLDIKSTLIGMKWGFASHMLKTKAENDSNKLSELIKEKNDLQDINEKMLDLLTEKELENEDLMDKMKENELKSKIEQEQNEEKIQSLEEKIKMLEDTKESSSHDIDNIINEYTTFQEKLKSQIKELSTKEEELQAQNNLKENTIQKLSEEIRDLEIKNYQLKIQSEKMAELKQQETEEQEQLITDNISIRQNNEYLNEKLKLMEQNINRINKLKEEEINNLEKKLEDEKIDIKNYKENKAKEIIELKNKMNKTETEMKFLSDKITQNEKLFNQEKEKNFIIQTNLDKKAKELKEISEYTKKLLANKDTLISQYEEKISDMAKEKNNLISQNKELLEKLKSNKEELVPTKSLEDIMNDDDEKNEKENLDFYINENKLLNEEINGLKEQLSTKGKDLNELKELNEENIKLKMKNEKLSNENENMQNKLKEYQKQEMKSKLMSMQSKISVSMLKLRNESKKSADKLNYDKQINALKKLKEEEKEIYENEIKKIKSELVLMKMKNMKQQALINATNDKIKNLNLKKNDSNINENITQNYYGYIILVLALIIIFLLDFKF